ncbi:MAG TPA: bifunctional glutamate N-acetyltransferase/amino-acid acetyltransferase ArgJ [Methylococcaceae bacterium]|nr:bifunctional glutamate N-acetyltransferase/amino-acid acetyltransferase ArgJ [Methylococcaceae bacterium]
MAVGAAKTPQLLPVAGVRIGTACAGIKRTTRDDLTLFELAEGSTCAAVFTQNAFCAAPVVVARQHLAHAPRWLLINSGNANAGTGVRGLEAARETCRALAVLCGGKPEQVLPFSTGVIGEYLPVDKIRDALPSAIAALDEAHWPQAMQAIMTTDTRPKGASRVVHVAGIPVTVTGICKGSGMIHPNMATMLAYLATDVRVAAPLLGQVLDAAVEETFNCVTVDGDTSTNDACVLMASGASGVSIDADGDALALFTSAVREVCAELAEAIARDGEGASKLIRVRVENAVSAVEAHRVANAVALSPLVKTAFFASDPNWGRILAAVGRAGCDNLDIARVRVWLDETCIVESGGRAPSYTEEAGQSVMAREDITVRIDLQRGTAARQVLTCDFSYDYVRINAEYRT